MIEKLQYRWRWLWMRFAHHELIGRFASYCLALGTQPYHGRVRFARLIPEGYFSPRTSVPRDRLVLGKHVYLGDGTTILIGQDSEESRIGDSVEIYGDAFVQTGQGGALVIHEGTHIQPGCHFRAFVSKIVIGSNAEIASGCSFYSFGHGMELGTTIMSQALSSKGGIKVGDGVWLGHGVTVLDGVTIGEGAVVGAHSVVTSDIPPNAIAVGIPAKVIRYRERGGGGSEAP